MLGSCGFIMMEGKFLLAGLLFWSFRLCAVLLEGSALGVHFSSLTLFWKNYTK